MFKAFEDMTVGDFDGLSVEAIGYIISQAPRRKTRSDAEIWRLAKEAADEMFNTNNYSD